MNRFFRSKIVLGFAAALGLAVLAADVQADHLTVSEGTDTAATITGAVRYRNFNNQGSQARIQVGDGLNGAGAVTNTTRKWTPGNTAIEISYLNGVLETVVGSTTVQKSGVAAPFNYLQITVNKNQADTSISLNNLSLAGHSLGNRGIASPDHGIAHWNVTGIDLSSGFTLTGTLNLTAPGGVGDFNPADSNFVQVAVGSVPATDADAPIVSDVDVTPKPVILNGDATVMANVDDSTTGDSPIASAEYSLNGGPWTLMAPSNPPFDAVVEDVKATFTALEVGTHEVCVRGTDAAGNTSSGDDCTEFLVTYNFEGFLRPIENSPIKNIAKAGQAVPVKWRLTDANGGPIGYPSSFAGLYSYEVACDTLAGNLEDAVEEYAPGSSGLQYNGDGYWQFNWKTLTTYANKCRALYVLLDSGAGSPAAYFQFKK